jgi:hypothetical protein
MAMHLSELLEHVEPSRLRGLGQLFEVTSELPPKALIDLIVDELPYCQTEDDGDCIGIDGAHFVVADLITDIQALDLLLETSWVRHEPDGKVITYRVDKSAAELSLSDVRLLLALLSIATSGDTELDVPPELSDERFAGIVHPELAKSPSVPPPPRPSQRPSRFPSARRPSIPPGFSPTLDSVRPNRNSVPPSPNSSAVPKPGYAGDRDFVEAVLMLPRNSVIAAAFALSERGAAAHAVSVGTRGRALLRRDQLGAAEQLCNDVASNISRLRTAAERADLERQLTKSMTFYGVKVSDASAVVAGVLEQGRFPEFYSDERPPPLEQVRSEFALLAKQSLAPALELLHEVFYRHCCATVESLRDSLGLKL